MLSVLDQSPVPEGLSTGDALRNSVDLAQLTDRLGFHRYWLAEHHGTPGLACASPEAIIGVVAESTSRLRVGSGGIMLPHYSPLKVAETFSMLGDMFPGRIDLGIGRAAGTSPRVAALLQRDRRQAPLDDFREQLDELLGYLGRDDQARSLFRQLTSIKLGGADPWLLGSSPQSAIWAAELGLPYVFADFINADGAEIAAYYRKAFQPSQWLKEPKMAVAAWAICAPTDEEAMRLSASMRMMSLLLYRGQLVKVPSVERAQAFLESEGMPAEMLPAGRRILTGTPQRVRRALENLAGEYGAEEVFVVNMMFDHQARRRSYELLAKAFGLQEESVPLIETEKT